VESVVKDKSVAFAKRIIRLYKFLVQKKERVMSTQILRCGTSIGANIVEAQCSYSKKEFLAKMYIAFKECAETLYWLELLFSEEYISIKQYDSLKNDCCEIKRLLSSITKSTANTLNNK